MSDTIPTRQEAGGPFRASVVVAVLIGAVGAWYLWRGAPCQDSRPPAIPRSVTPRGDLASDEKTTIEIFERASPSVVFVTSVAIQTDYFGLNPEEIPQGAGSGFIWDSAGHVVTNFHVIQDANAVTVTLSDHSAWQAEFVGAEPDKDLAVLRIRAPAARLRPIAIGTSKDLLVGQKVFAIGNPFGLDQSLTTGVVSALGRNIRSVTGRTISDVIQTDAAINPGNSGGPLLDSAGRLIGVNTQIYSPSGAFAGIGFAIPVDTVNRVVPELIARGRVTRPRLGIQVFPDSITRRLGIEGVLIRDVEEASGAAQAGLRGTRQARSGAVILGDVIVAINGKRVRNTDELLNALEKHAPGDVVEVTYRRGDEENTVRVTLQ